MKVIPFFIQELTWRARACQWWRLWERQGGLRASLRRLPEGRLAAAARERAEAASLMADLCQAWADVWPLGVVRG